MRKMIPVLLAASTAAAFMSGCSSGCGGETTPAFTAPNGTLEQVANNADYADTLGKLTVKQHIDFTTSAGERVIVYNFTSTPVPEASVKKITDYYVNLGSKAASRTVTIHPDGIGTSVQAATSEISEHAVEHDVLLVPEGTDPPESFNPGGTTAVTQVFEEQRQTISVVEQDENAGVLQSFEKEPGLPVEACQALVKEYVVPTGTDELRSMTEEHLVQETMCNSYGHALAAAANNASYDEYATPVSTDLGTVSRGSQTFTLTPYVFTAAEYAAMPR